MKYIFLPFIALCLLLNSLSAQDANTGTITGKVTDKETGEGLWEAVVFVVGTYSGGKADEEGKYQIANLKPGTYSVRITYVGYAEQLVNGVEVKAGQITTLNAPLTSQSKTLETVEIIGESMVDLESGKSTNKISAETLKDMSVTDVQSVTAMQIGVNKTQDGIQIRGGRVYETQYYVDGINAQSRLAGTGFGVDVAQNAIDEVEVVTGGASAEFGGATSGLVLTKIKEGGDSIQFNGSYRRDNLGFNKASQWNTDIANFSFGGALITNHSFKKRDSTEKKSKHKEKGLFFFVGGDMRLTDEYTKITANQLHSSIISNSETWAPRQDNRWSNTLKLTYRIKPGVKISLMNQNSLTINQNTRMLQIVGNQQILTPGLQFAFKENMDNAQTYTQRSNLTILNFQSSLGQRWTMNLIFGRMFSNLRADANGRPFRDSVLNQVYDAYSIITDPVSLYNPGDSVVYVNPATGFINNGGIASLWHDHYEQEYTFKANFNHAPKSKTHYFSFGYEHKEQEFQWVDVFKPWVGAPIRVGDQVISSNRVGISNEIWKVNPAEGGVFFEDRIRFNGIIANVGFRFTYWTAGKYADDAIKNMQNPLPQTIRNEYQDQTVGLFGRRWKARFLPNLRVSFPVTENNVLYFNYSHTLRTQHPRFLYSGLDPRFLTRGFLDDLGNPNLNPETTVAYEVGLKSKLGKKSVLTVTAFYKDQFDFVVNRIVQVRNPQTGRFEDKSLAINQDYARIRGLEVSYTQKIGSWFTGNLAGSYTIATGKSNSAYESKLGIKTDGRVDANRENYLAWDRPFDVKGTFIFKGSKNSRIWKIPTKGFTATFFMNWRSGFRYTPMIADRVLNYGRTEYVVASGQTSFTEVGSNWFWVDFRLAKSFKYKKVYAELVFEIKNLLNNQNAQLINPVTGRAYEQGDDVPGTWRDPKYNYPTNTGITPLNPARFLEPRQLMLGINFGF